jgi:membrane protein DedA with SNARE-associated domain
MGSMDCLTTVVGTQFFGTREINPFIAGLVNSNLPTFVALKLAVTVCVALIFVFAEKTLLGNGDKSNRAFKIAHNTLRASYVGVVLFLVFVVVNNVVVICGSPL